MPTPNDSKLARAKHPSQAALQRRDSTLMAAGSGSWTGGGTGTGTDPKPARGSKASAAVASKTLKRTGTKVVDGLGRWLGVVGDDEELRARREMYLAQKRGAAPKQAPLSQLQNNMLNDLDDDDSSDDEERHKLYNPTGKEFNQTHSVEEAMEHYHWLRDEELSKIVKPGWFGGEVNAPHESVSDGGLDMKGSRQSKHRRKSKFRRNTVVQAQLLATKTYSPVFIDLISFLQFAVFVFLMAYGYTQGDFAPIALSPTKVTCTNTTEPPCALFNGSLALSDVRYKEVNPLIGPTSSYLLSLGAQYTLCMRTDDEFNAYAEEQLAEECCAGRGTQYACPTPDTGYGCCTLTNGHSGMTNNASCHEADPNASWLGDTLCNEQTQEIYIRPCCGIAYDGHCTIMTEERCGFLGGTWQRYYQLCSQVMCLSGVCDIQDLGDGLTAKSYPPNEPQNPNQGFRLVTALFLHAGAIQFVIVIAIQLYVGRDIERHVGFLRMLLIWFISGVGGNLVGGIFTPYQITCGGDPAIYGLLGVTVVELFQSWQIVERPWRELLKISAMCILLFFVGTFPFFNNWSHIGGFCFGIVCAIVFVPTIYFGRWSLARKRLLLLICMPLLVAMLIIGFVVFYVAQSSTSGWCSNCDIIDCVPYVPDICTSAGGVYSAGP